MVLNERWVVSKSDDPFSWLFLRKSFFYDRTGISNRLNH